MDDLNTTEEKLELDYKRIIKVIMVGSLFSLIILEIMLLYFDSGGALRFPENLIFFLVVGSFIILVEDAIFSVYEVGLTIFTTLFSMIFMFNLFFQSSTNPGIVVSFFSLNPQPGADDILLDYMILGFIGGSFWLFFLAGITTVIKKAGKVSMRNTFGSLSKKGSDVIAFFDAHPWAVTILIVVISGVVGIIIGSIK